ncbi:MAG: hypothetical protein Q9170_005860 [Blastenia crenularia]
MKFHRIIAKLGFTASLGLVPGVYGRVLKFHTDSESLIERYEATTSPALTYTGLSKYGSDEYFNEILPRGSDSMVEIPDIGYQRRNIDRPSPSTRAASNRNTLVARSSALQPRFLSFLNGFDGYRMTWEQFVSIAPSVHAAYAFIILYSKLAVLARDAMSGKRPIGSFQVKYGTLRASCESENRNIPLKVVLLLAKKLEDAAKRNFLGLMEIRVSREKVNGVAVQCAITLTGIMVARAGLPDPEGAERYLTNIVG